MIDIFHGNNSETHQRFQAWRKANVDGFHMTESAALQFTIHYAQDKRENAAGRGCNHQGGSDIEYLEDKDGCYTTARKVCSNSLAELIAWATDRSLDINNCKHCDTKIFTFPTVVSQVVGLAEGSVAGVKHFVSYHNAEKMGYSFEQAEPFSVGTAKSVERLRGERVWSISGEGRPLRYHLRDTWVVDDVGESSQDEFSNYARGRGIEFTPPIPISDLPWFSAFLKSQSNFRLGLQHIKDEFVPHFDALLAGRAAPAAVQAAGNVRGPLPV